MLRRAVNTCNDKRMNPATVKFQSFFSVWLVITASLLTLLFNACSAAPTVVNDPSKPTKEEIDAVNNSVAEVSHEVSMILILSSTRSVPTASPQNKGNQSVYVTR